MSTSDLKNKGYPKSLLKKDWSIYKYCGGGGGGPCPFVQNNTQIVFSIETNPYLVYNRSMLLRNPEFFGIVLYDDLGSDGFCPNSYNENNPQDWYLGFSASGSLTDQEVIDQGLKQEGKLPPFDIEVFGSQLPQPTDDLWQEKIFVHVVWLNSAFISDQLYTDDVQYLRPVKHNYDVRQ